MQQCIFILSSLCFSLFSVQCSTSFAIKIDKYIYEIIIFSDEERKEDCDKSDHSKRGRLPSFLGDTSIASTDNKSRTTPDSQKLILSKGNVHREYNSDKFHVRL